MSDPIDRNTPPDALQQRGAIAGFLQASGFSLDHPHLRDTPERVAECWQQQLLDGYQLDPATLLGETYDAESDGLIVVRDIQLHGLCPHHLLPFVGKAHLAYLPDQRIVGFSKLCELVRCFAHRLTLQETLTQQLPAALMEHLQAKGAGCVIEAQHHCMILRAPEHHASQVITSAFLGQMQSQPALQQVLLARS